MKKTITLARLVVLFFACAAYVTTYAQQATTTNTSKTQSIQVSQKNGEIKAKLPYLNYKGIKDAEQAKVAWIKDNPDAYRRMKQGKTTPANK